MKLLIIVIFFGVNLWGVEGILFYQTDNFPEDDLLNVRQQPNYRAKKIDTLSLGVPLEVLQCTHNKTSKWCKIKPLYAPDTIGWVNAKFIAPQRYQEGYVTIEGQATDCAYLLECYAQKCSVVTSLGEGETITPQRHWFARNRIHPATQFSAMPNDPDANGYCTTHHYLYDYLSHQKMTMLQETFPSQDFGVLIEMLYAIDQQDSQKIASLIHPLRGIRLSALSYFDPKRSQHFTQQTFLDQYKQRQILFWGEREGRAERIDQDLYAYLQTLPHDIPHISKVVPLNDLRNYPQQADQRLKAYEIFWYGGEGLSKEYAYQGLIVILEAYQSNWYVVGISRDYWTP